MKTRKIKSRRNPPEAYPRSRAPLSKKEVEKLDALFFILNRTPRYTPEFEKLTSEIDAILEKLGPLRMKKNPVNRKIAALRILLETQLIPKNVEKQYKEMLEKLEKELENESIENPCHEKIEDKQNPKSTESMNMTQFISMLGFVGAFWYFVIKPKQDQKKQNQLVQLANSEVPAQLTY